MEDLIKKLEKISVPEIEIPGHKERLRAVLLKKHSEQKRSRWNFSISWKLAPLGLATILLTLAIFNNLFFSESQLKPTLPANQSEMNYSLSEIKNIALEDPRVSELVGKNAVVKNVKIIENRAYVLIQSTEKQQQKISSNQSKEFSYSTSTPSGTEKIKAPGLKTFLAEIDLKEKKVERVEYLGENATSSEVLR